MRTFRGVTAIRTGTTLAAIAAVILAGALTVFRAEATLPPIIDLNTTSAGLTVYGDDAGDLSGQHLVSGDINGDGIDDLIIGAYLADPAGETYVIYGGSKPPATIDLNTTSADLTVYGDDGGDQSGFSVAAGDINGDGTDDLIIGASFADPAGGTTAGETYVIYGGPGLPATIDLNSTSADLTVYGDDGGDQSGFSVAAGDISGDGTDDLIIGAIQADPVGGTGAGETYVIYGGTPGIDLPAVGGSIDLNSGPADLTVYGDDAGDLSSHAVAARDISGDATDDLIVGAIFADPAGRTDAGATYVIYGGTPGVDLPAVGGTIDLDSTSADLTVYGDDAGDFSGGTATAGDVDGDTTADLLIGAREADPAARTTAGETYVIYGGTPGVDLPAVGGTIDLNSTSADLTVFGDDAGDQSGIRVAVGDLNGDGTGDIIVGANFADPAGGMIAGATYVIYGGPELPVTIDLNTTSADLSVYGDDPDDQSGHWVAAGDIDGDSIDDLIIAAHKADPTGGSDAGETYVIYGRAAPPVGGIAELPEVAGAPLETGGSSGASVGALAGIAAVAVTGTVALGGAAWYARRRWAREP